MSKPHTYLLSLLDGDGFSCPNHEALERELFDAIRGGALPAADICIRDETAIGGFRSIRDSPGVCAQIRNGWISDERRGKTYVTYYLDAEPFREWLKSTGRWPLPPGHVLGAWLVGETTKSPERKPRKRHDRLHCAIVTALGGKPNVTADALFDWLAAGNDETGTIIDFTDEKLVWEDTARKAHDIDRATFANRVSRIRAKPA